MDRMTPELWRRVKEVATVAWDRDEPARRAYVDEVCADDPGLRTEVLSLLQSAEAATPYFEVPGGGVQATALSSGSRIGPYRLIRRLASGGMGSVYLAERDDGEFTQRVAIKVVRGGFANPFLLQRFREERRILASLEHPNVARLLDGGTTETGLPWVAMEYVEGLTIDGFCRTRQLSVRARLRVFRDVCAAVQYAHQHLVIHRDIKAANILVTGDGIAKLLDFGIAKLLDPDTGLESSTHTTVRVMTPESASPEQLAGKPLTVAADVYALGVLLYRLLADRSPYRGDLGHDADLIRAVSEQIPEPPSLAQASGLVIPRDVDMIVMKALRKEPARRYGSAEQLSDDIRRFLDGHPVLASPDSLAYRSRKFIARHRVAVPAIAAGTIALALGLGATLWQARAAQRERARADFQRARAERQFNAVRSLAHSVMGELHDAVSRLPGSTPAREILLRRGTEYLDTLSADASADEGLRRELADGYIHLAAVQGVSGLPNLGDRESTRRNLKQAIALLETLAGPAHGDLKDRLQLAESCARLANVSNDDGVVREDLLAKSRAVVDALTPAERGLAPALTVRQSVWSAVAQGQLNVRDYAGAKSSYQQVLEAAESALRQSPASGEASRNLSLAYKQLGAVLEVLHARAQAMPLYDKALALDRDRVAREPARSLWRLDLSFSYGAIGAALMSEGDLKGALAHYDEAVRLRRRVVEEDPGEDFAKTALARGYERLAIIHGRLGDVSRSFDFDRQRVAVMRERLDAHPERENVWREYAQTALAAIGGCLDLLESPQTTPRVRRAHASEVGPMIDQLALVRERWIREKRTGSPIASEDDLRLVRERMRRLGA